MCFYHQPEFNILKQGIGILKTFFEEYEVMNITFLQKLKVPKAIDFPTCYLI